MFMKKIKIIIEDIPSIKGVKSFENVFIEKYLESLLSRGYLVISTDFSISEYIKGSDHWTELGIGIVEARSASEAINKYIKETAIRWKHFLEFVYGRTLNFSLIEKFWPKTVIEKEEYCRLDNGEEKLFDDVSIFLSDKKNLENEVYRFFAPHQDFAKKYLDFYYDKSKSVNDFIKEEFFSKEMLTYMFTHLNWDSFIAFPIRDLLFNKEILFEFTRDQFLQEVYRNLVDNGYNLEGIYLKEGK